MLRSALFRLGRSRWFRTFLGVLVLCVLIWFLGPLLGLGALHPLETVIARAIAIGVLLVLWLITNLLAELSARRRDTALTQDVTKAAPKADAGASAEEAAVMAKRLREALHTLRRAGRAGGARRLATLPWYMFIGPPGAGKTTALLHCGLNFPLAEEGARPRAGVGGTRDCDWWFTDQAVLIDTAGRYTTQDSHEAVDAAGWLGFLRALKKHRRRQPLNGAVVAISLSDLATLGEAERDAHARAIRRRIRELHDELGVRLPIYVLFTKADLIAGFVEFFDGMGREEREQVWGMTFPLDNPRAAGASETGVVAAFGPEFDALLGRLNERMLERVNQETDVQRRRLIYGFPQQVASMRDVAQDFLTAIFAPSRLEAAPLLRGVYLASGTQSGTPIDRLVGQMSASFGLPRPLLPAFGGAGRSYFLARLMREVVFGEAALVSLDPRVERRARWTRRAAWATCAVVLLGLAAAWSASYVGNLTLIDEVHAGAAEYNRQYAELLHLPPADLAASVPTLDTLRGVRGGYGQRDRVIPIALTFGLYQGQKLSVAASDAYARALNRLLLPRLLARLEQQMAAQPDKLDFLYQALKVYLILGARGPLDRDVVEQWFSIDLPAALPGDDNAPLVHSLMDHIDALLEQPLESVPLDEGLIHQVRAALTREPLAEYSYNRILRSKRVQAIPAWTVAENGEPGASRVFRMRSGRSLDVGIPGIYTWAGYHNVFAAMLPFVAQDITEDGWVLGHAQRDVATTLRDAGRLRRDVLGLYLDDYSRRWDAFIADIGIRPFTSIQEGLDQLFLLSAPDSPLRNLLAGIDAQVTLSRPAATDAVAAAAQQKARRVGERAGGFASFEARSGLSMKQNQLADILGEALGQDPTAKPVDPAHRVDEHFAALHQFVAGSENQPAKLEDSLQKIRAMYEGLNQAASSGNPGQSMMAQMTGTGSGSVAATAQLQQVARDMPPAVAAMLQTVTQSGAQVAASGATEQLGQAWSSTVLPLCQQIADRYPFVADSTADVPAEDFATLLGPGGLLDKFFEQNLKPFVDTTHRPWAWQNGQHLPLGVQPGSLALFQRAADIRDALFHGPAMAVRFELAPVSLDPQIAQVSIDVGDQTLAYSHGPPASKRFQWPDAGGKTALRVTLTPTDNGPASVTDRDGPWALLRMLDAARVSPSGQPDRFRVQFTGAGGTAAFDLNASSVRNPFAAGMLHGFRCPAKL